MYNVNIKNGYAIVTCSDDDTSLQSFRWLTKEYDRYFFHVNLITKMYFNRDMVNDSNCYISQDDLNYINSIDLIQKEKMPSNFTVPYLGKDRQGNDILLKDYQIHSVKMMLTHKNYCLFLGAGTGKTFIAITYLCNTKPKNILVLTPKKVIKQYTDEVNSFLTYTPDLLQVTNYEDLQHHPEKFKHHYDCIILDESHRVKNPSSQTHKLIQALSFNHMYLFTGTPQDACRFEIIAQMCLFNKKIMPSKTKFINRYFETDDYHKPTKEKQGFSFELDTLIQGLSFGRSTEQVIKLTQKIDHEIKIPKTAMYKTLAKDRMFIAGGYEIVCDTPPKLSQKLLETSSGLVVDDNGAHLKTSSLKPYMFDNLLETVDTAIIYTQFDIDIIMVKEVLDKRGKSYGVVNGKTSSKKSNATIDGFKNKEIDYLVIQSASGNAGLDLTVTNNIIFYTLPTSYIVFEQCQKRIRRLGQEKDCHYYYLISSGVERKIYTSLKNKKSFTNRLFNSYIRSLK